MNTKLLTAYNEDIQRYIERPAANKKRSIINEIKSETLKRGINFNKLFPANTKRYQVLDEIVYLLSTGGICTVESRTLADRVGASVRTVSDAVKHIKELDLFVVGGLADGKNKYVFIYKNHESFTDILLHVFYVDPAEVLGDNKADNAEQIAEQESAESIDNKAIEGDISEPIYINLLKQEKDIYKSIRNSIESRPLNIEYLTNEYQRKLCDAIKSDNLLHDDIKQEAYRLALRAGSNMNAAMYRKAFVSIWKIDRHLTLGGKIERSIPALFDKIYRDRIDYASYYRGRNKPRLRRDSSVYYDWTKEGTAEC